MHSLGLWIDGGQIFGPLCSNHQMDIIAYTDSDSKKWGGQVHGVPIVPPEQLFELEYDCIMIAVYSPDYIRDIKKKLIDMGISESKIITLVLEPDFIDIFVNQRINWIKDFAQFCYERNVGGNVAECGVYLGECAKFINRFFYDRKLYLFDTFEGFDAADVEYEKNLNNQAYNNSQYAQKGIFTDTDMKMLMCKMKYPDNIDIRKGYFPQTASNVEDKFCFVNLDMDLYLPMLSALRFFGDKMVDGGCILLHDYFHPELPGVKMAVEAYEKEINGSLHKLTIGDGCSLALIF